MKVKLYREDVKQYVIKEEVFDLEDLKGAIKRFCENEKIDKCKFVLEGSAELVERGKEPLTALFG